MTHPPRPLAILLALTVSACGGPARPEPAAPVTPPYDLLITGGTIVDGTGAPGYRGDVLVQDGRIARVSRGSLAGVAAVRTIDASGLVVAPGFIDQHAHIEAIFSMPGAESHLRQGVTTAVGGPDGGGPFPVARWLDSAQATGVALNVATYVGHNTVRRRVMGSADRAPDAAELGQMKQMVAQAMGEGALGLSSGLEYVPGAYAHPDEVVALARVAADSGGVYTSHVRNETHAVMASVLETIDVGRRAGIPTTITHAKVVGKPSWGRSTEMLEAVEAARREGVDAMLDVYPYTASSTGLTILVPSWALAGGDTAFARRVRDPVLRDSIVAGIVRLIDVERGGGDLEFVQFARVPWNRGLEGKRLADWARSRGLVPSPAVGAQLVIEAMLEGGAGAVYHVMSEDDVRRLLASPHAMVASDGGLARPGSGHPHPRAYGTFPRVLARYVREQRVLTLEQAVQKMTEMPARRLGLRDRGRVAAGLSADLVLFDPATVEDRATFTEPHQYPLGIPYVIVNGVVAVDRGAPTAARAGRALRRPSTRLARLRTAIPAIDSTVRAFAARSNVPGFAYGIVVDGKLLHVGTGGLRDVAARAPVDTATVFRIASMSKSFAAAAILQLRDAGKLALDDPAERYVPELAGLAYATADAPRITIRHLLTHSAGFPEDNPWGDQQLAATDEAMSAMMRAGIPFSTSPGTAYEYSNFGYAILGRVVANVSGMPYSQYLREHVLLPLGMGSTTLEAAAVPAARLAHGYRWQDGTWLEEAQLPDGAFGPMGGMLTSISDLSRWVGLMLDAWPPRDDADTGPLRRASLREMQQVWRYTGAFAAPDDAGGVTLSAGGYGYGLGVRQTCDFRISVSHTGGLPGFGSLMRWLPDHGVGIVALGNVTYTGWTSVAEQALQHLAATGGLVARASEPSPVLLERQEQVSRLVASWDDALADTIAAMNLYLDESRDRRRASIARLVTNAGGECRREGAIVAENRLRGMWRLRCRTGDLLVRITLAPTSPARVQYLAVSPLGRDAVLPMPAACRSATRR